MDIDPEKLARALKSVDAMPERSSRSYLAPAEALILKLRAKGRTFREIRKQLAEDLGVHPSLSTLHHFTRQAKRRLARLKGVAGPPSMPVKFDETPAVQHGLTGGPAVSAADDGQTAKAAIRALKAKPKLPKEDKGSALYSYDRTKPLTIRSHPKKT